MDGQSSRSLVFHHRPSAANLFTPWALVDQRNCLMGSSTSKPFVALLYPSEILGHYMLGKSNSSRKKKLFLGGISKLALEKYNRNICKILFWIYPLPFAATAKKHYLLYQLQASLAHIPSMHCLEFS